MFFTVFSELKTQYMHMDNKSNFFPFL
uniref:Uncharacterized protein n=1 Tax=Anguilla anguilla TaxID=7936 RepID=A0A0E9VE21_ANGAN